MFLGGIKLCADGKPINKWINFERNDRWYDFIN